jgi:hypothetical protein
VGALAGSVGDDYDDMDWDLDWDEEESAADGDDEDWSSDGPPAVPALSR